MKLYDIEKYRPTPYTSSRFWAVYTRDDPRQLVCVTVYKKGAEEVVRRLTNLGRSLISLLREKRERGEF